MVVYLGHAKFLFFEKKYVGFTTYIISRAHDLFKLPTIPETKTKHGVHLPTVFSLPELKAQVSFTDHLSSVVCLSVCPSVRLSVCLSVCL